MRPRAAGRAPLLAAACGLPDPASFVRVEGARPRAPASRRLGRRDLVQRPDRARGSWTAGGSCSCPGGRPARGARRGRVRRRRRRPRRVPAVRARSRTAAAARPPAAARRSARSRPTRSCSRRARGRRTAVRCSTRGPPAPDRRGVRDRARPGPPPRAVLTEVRADAETPEAGGEYVEVANLGEGTLDLSGWRLAKRTATGALSSCTVSAPPADAVAPGGVALVAGGAYDGRYALPDGRRVLACGATALLGGIANDRPPELLLLDPPARWSRRSARRRRRRCVPLARGAGRRGVARTSRRTSRAPGSRGRRARD